MRIAFIVPWFRTLGHLYGRILQGAGHDVLVATTGRHFESAPGLCDEVLAGPDMAVGRLSWQQIRTLRAAVERFRPQIIFEDVLKDPRWLFIGGRPVRRVVMVHDPLPHDARHRLRGLRQLTVGSQLRHADAVICFSSTSAQLMSSRTRLPIFRVPLISEMPDEMFRGLETIRDGFGVVGRLSAYKGIDLAIDAWEGLPRSLRERHPLKAFVSEGDSGILARLERVSGSSLRLGRYEFDSMAQELAKCCAVLLPYRSASQSGVQLLAMQLGVAPIVSDCGGLREYQPDGCPILGTTDHAAWVRAMIAVTEDLVALDLGVAARNHYEAITRTTDVVAAFGPALNLAAKRQAS